MSIAIQAAGERADAASLSGRGAFEWTGAVFEQVVEAAPDAMLVVGGDGVIEFVNKQAEELFGWSRADLLKQSVDKLVPHVGRGDHAKRRDSFMAHPSTRTMGASLDLSAVRADGTEVPVDISLSPIRLADGTNLVVVAIRDVTEKRRAADALREANSDLTAIVADLQARSQSMTILSRGSEALQGCTDMDEALELIGRAAPMMFADLVGGLFSRQRDGANFATLTTWGAMEDGEIAPDDCWALRTGHVHVFGTDPLALRCKHVAAEVTWSVCIPLIAQHETIAVIHIRDGGDIDPAGRYANRQEEVGRLLSTQWGLTLANLLLRETLHSQSIRDPLTGLYNRRYLDEWLRSAHSRAERHQSRLAVVMIDLDHFKAFNDSHGHPGGDTVLRSLGRFLLEKTRGEDVVARFGGEEFVVVFPEVSAEDAVARVNGLIDGWRDRSEHSAGDLHPYPTMSAGIAMYPTHATEITDLFVVADRALYQAKHAGRDRLVLGMPFIAQPK